MAYRPFQIQQASIRAKASNGVALAVICGKANRSRRCGRLWRQTGHVKSRQHLGVVAIGYGEVIPVMPKTGTPVLINGKRVPLVGRVSMDMITVDL